MTKLTLECRGFRPVVKNTLRGFAEVYVKDMCLTIRDVALHVKGDSRWASLPAKPMVMKDGTVAKDDTTGKMKFVNILEFSSRDVASAFSSAVIAAVLRHSPNAFGEPVEADPGF
jgi:hypothetical protein